MTRVLIVDDKERNLYALRVLLEGYGCEVDSARHGAEALVKARQNPPDLVISDLLMPVMDGFTLLRHWKTDGRLKTIPFVVYTATYTEPKDEHLALSLGADAFVVKPAEPEAFMARIRQVVTSEQRDDMPPVRSPQAEERVVLKEYNEVLVHKLEKKARELSRDIEARRAVEAALRESEARSRALLEQAADALFVHDVDGRILEVNRRACETLGYSPRELLRMGVEDIEPDRLRPELEEFWRRTQPGQSGTLYGRHRRKDGTVFPVEVRWGCLMLRGQRLFLDLVRDVTEQNRREDLLRQSREQLRALAVRLQASREQESLRIAREVHDQVGQALTTLNLHLAWLGQHLDPAAAPDASAAFQDRLQSMSTLLGETVRMVQRISTELRPAALDDLGLAAAIAWHVEAFQKTAGLRCEVRCPVLDHPPDRNLSTVLFRILQEALTNVARHAQASRVSVSLIEEPARWVLEVTDDGRGITEAELNHTQSLGLAGMRERALAMGGTVEIRGAPGSGTIVTAALPK